MKTRVISGAVFVAIIVGMFLLRQFVDWRIFQLLNFVFCTIGTFEVARALKGHLKKSVNIILIVYGALFVPIYALVNYLLSVGNGYIVALGFMALTGLIVIIVGGFDSKSLIGLVPVFYPSLLILTMLMCNDLGVVSGLGIAGDKGFIATLLIFVISPFTDTMAYFTGSLLKGPKLCPKLSPKKTISGAIGGLIGGIAGALLVYFIFKPQVNFFSPVLLFILIGIFGGVLTQVGDLFESFIKRKVGIKDMGKIMPGHGGVMDRIDGMSFLSVLTFAVFMLV